VTADALLQLAMASQRMADELAAQSRLLAAAGAPMTLVQESLDLAKRELVIAQRLYELAQNAAPMPRRD
jgi:hypothetical protein